MNLNWIRYSLHYKQSFFSTEKSNTKRDVYLLGLSDDDGVKGIGEIAPLPEWGTETFDQVEPILSAVKILLDKKSEISIEPKLSNIFPSIELSSFPATSFGLEGIIRTYLHRKYPLRRTTGEIGIPISITIGNNETETLILEIEKWHLKGFNTYKIKLSDQPSDVLYSRINDLCKTFNDCSFRLDLQGKWTIDETIRFSEKMHHLNIEYLEQPITKLNLLDCISIVEKSKIPIAVDETLQTLSDAGEWMKQSQAILIMKPSTFGSISNLFEWLNRNDVDKTRIVFSSALDTKLSAFWYAYLAKESGCDYRAAGIATFLSILNDPILTPVEVVNGWLEISAGFLNQVCFLPEIESALFDHNVSFR